MQSTSGNLSLSVDVLILCALREEYVELLNVTDGICDGGWRGGKAQDGWLVSEAEFAAQDGKPLRVVASYCAHMGREQAAATLSHLWYARPARCIAMSGVCAGRRGKVALGDVVFADRLYSYDAGKITVKDGKRIFQGDPNQTGPSVTWVQRMHEARAALPGGWIELRPKLTLEEQEDWVVLRLDEGSLPTAHVDFADKCLDWADVFTRLVEKTWINATGEIQDSGRERARHLRLLHGGQPEPQPDFDVHVAPMATGAAVVEDPNIFWELSGNMRKVLAIDMEGSALGIAAEFMKVPVVIAKAVSDFGDTLKDDRVRTFAARAAAEYLLTLLRSSVDLLRTAGGPISTAPTPVTSPAVDDANGFPRELIEFLADTYPETQDARALWMRAGGKGGQVPTLNHPRDLWQRLWAQSVQGAAARPASILRAVLTDYPENPTVLRYLANFDH
ncbi:effector-associated domain EAD1-containing protein [Burkholderia sp. JPY481]